MRLSEVHFEGAVPIDGYGPGFFRVAGTVYEGALLVAAGHISGWTGIADFSAVIAVKDSFDVLLVGTGADIAPLPATARAALDNAGIGLDLMTTPTACRTYNVLLAEGRRVMAALAPV